MKGYDYLKKALDGELEPKTIIRTLVLYEDNYDYDYYIYHKDNMFHGCNKDGKLGAKYQDRFLNYKVLEKDFEFYCVLEEEKKIPEKLPYYSMEKIQKAKNKDEWQEERITLLEKRVNDLHIKMNDLLDYLKSKGE